MATDVQLVELQCPVGLSAHDLSDALFETGAMYVSISDGNQGTDAEEPIFGTHSVGSSEMHLESWSELMEARQLWSNSTLEVGFAPGADVEGALLSAAAMSGHRALPRFTITNLAQRDWVTEVQSK